MAERGFLGKWGPNHAADPIVTRNDPESGALQVVAIVRTDSGIVALPGGMVDPGEAVSATVKREFTEEAVNISDANERAEAERLLATLFDAANGKLIHKGYVDDLRNTDHAWMETQAIHFHCDGAAARLRLAAGDDAAAAFWLDATDSNAQYASMLPDHKSWVDAAAAKLRQGSLMANMRRGR